MSTPTLITVDELTDAVKGAAAISTDFAQRIHAAAVQMVTDYAPDAPTEIVNEAIVRLGGYLAQSDFGTIRSETLGPQSFEFVTNHAAMFRNSGAMALLTRYKRRRAGAV